MILSHFYRTSSITAQFLKTHLKPTSLYPSRSSKWLLSSNYFVCSEEDIIQLWIHWFNVSPPPIQCLRRNKKNHFSDRIWLGKKRFGHKWANLWKYMLQIIFNNVLKHPPLAKIGILKWVHTIRMELQEVLWGWKVFMLNCSRPHSF